MSAAASSRTCIIGATGRLGASLCRNPHSRQYRYRLHPVVRDPQSFRNPLLEKFGPASTWNSYVPLETLEHSYFNIPYVEWVKTDPPKAMTVDQMLETPSDRETWVLAVKPSDAPEILDKMAPHVTDSTFIISTMAGSTPEALADTLNTPNVVCAMPNLAHASLETTTFWTCLPELKQRMDSCDSDSTQGQALQLLFGHKTMFVENSEKMFMITALNGSGPAYFAYIAKIMFETGIANGLSREESAAAVESAYMAAATAGDDGYFSICDPIGIIGNVSSEGGTTQAALEYWRDGVFEALLHNGVKLSAMRAHEMADKRFDDSKKK